MDLNNLNFEQSLDESKMLLDDASRVADEDYEFTLESILAEFGGSDARDASSSSILLSSSDCSKFRLVRSMTVCPFSPCAARLHIAGSPPRWRR